MLSDLLPAPIAKVWWLARRVLILGSVALAIGMTAVGTGRTLDEREGRNHAPSAASLAISGQSEAVLASATLAPSGELLHDLPAEAAASHLPRMSETGASHGHVVWMEVTAYCPCPKCCGAQAVGITASGLNVSYNAGRFVAADTDVLPFGTKVLVPGYDAQPVEVIDRGGAIRGNRLDVFFPTHEEALRWGRRIVAVTVID